MASSKGKRNWCIIAYPESMPADWKQILIETGLPISISPLHDRDEKEDCPGELKKPHYHIILCWPGPTTANNVKELAGRINASTWKPVESVRGAYRYHTHQDNPEKAQYNDRANEIINLNGFDPESLNELTSTELRLLSKECLKVINEQGLFEYADLIDFLDSLSEQDKEQSKLFDYATSHTIMLNNYLSSKRNKAKLQAEAEKLAFSKRKKAGESVMPDASNHASEGQKEASQDPFYVDQSDGEGDEG